MSKRLTAYINFNRGRNGTASADSLLASEMREAQNVDLMVRGGYSQRKGCIKALVTPLGTTGISRLIKYPGMNLAIIDKKLVKWDGTVLLSTLSSNDVGVEYFTNQKLYIVDGTKYYVYDGTTIAEVTPATSADLTNVKNCKLLIQRGQRMFAMGDNTNNIYFSATGEPNNFTASQAIRALSTDLYNPVAAALYGDALIIFKRNSVYAWTGWDPTTDVEFHPLRVHDGTQSPRSVCAAEDYLLYLGDDAIVALVSTEKDVISTMKVSTGVTDIIETLTNRDKAVGVYYRGCYYLACCDDGSGINNLVLKGYVTMAFQGDETISLRSFPWTLYRGWSVADWFKDDNDDLYFASASTGMIYKAFQGDNDDGIPIVMQAKHRLNLDDSFRIKKLKSILLLARQYEGESCYVEVDISLGYYKVSKGVRIDESGFWDISDWDDNLFDFEDIVKKQIDLNGHKCDRLEITIRHDVIDEPVTIYGYGAVFKPKKPKGVKTNVTNI
ncbi:MAG: hypothetical protein HF312_17080 [Ignavibacteria bacterium]|nr:hypothetical protein [Ignavibacteria bacterium]